MIPKIIHYCWFGGSEKPDKAKKCIASWIAHCPDYEIREWNEGNVSLDACPEYVQDAYEAKKYAYVADYIRLKAIYDCGGFYMDTDVELLKRLDPFRGNSGVIGFENNEFVNSGQMLAAEAGHPVLAEMMARYHEIAFYREDGSMYLLGCPHVNTEALVNHGLVRNGQEQIVAGFHVYPADRFNPLNSATGEIAKTENTVSIHWYSMSWIPAWKRVRVIVLRKVRRLLKKLGIRR
jgi:metal-dependent hydrolase (beta-lactamase superfamily II)